MQLLIQRLDSAIAGLSLKQTSKLPADFQLYLPADFQLGRKNLV